VAQRIVIVDDAALNRRVMESLVARLPDVEVQSFSSSADALKQAPHLAASLFIIDYQMPAPDGMALLSSLRADERTSRTPIVMVTAAEERDVCYAALERGASDFLVRPIDPREFTRRIGNLLALEAARQEHQERLVSEEQAGRLHAHRLDMIWRAGTAVDDDRTFLSSLVDGASRAIVEGRHFFAGIARVENQGCVFEVSNGSSDGIGTSDPDARLPNDDHRDALAANTIEMVGDLPFGRRGDGNWRASVFAPFQVDATRYFLCFYSHEPVASFTALDAAFIETIAGLCSMRLHQRLQFERLNYQTEHDALTGLINRTSFRLQGLAVMHQSRDVALLVLDLDNFRHTNDTLGNETGDALLIEVAERLSATAGEHETLARLAGDSFGLIVADCVSRSEAQERATRYLRTFDYPFAAGERENQERVSLRASIGIAIAPDDGDDFELLLARADAACYAAKDAGGSRWSFFDPGVEEMYAATRLLHNELLAALAGDQFELHFQPHVNLRTRDIVGAEALIRWRHPDRGLVAPGAFIPFAERRGLAAGIGAWVMREAAGASQEWRRADPGFCAWFNLTATEMRDESLTGRLEELGDDLSGLGVEITESAAMENIAETLAVMNQLRSAGVRIALDDFGTGYSSLAQLKRLPIDVVKIDGSFIAGLPADHHDRAIIDAVLSIGRSYGYETLAEGIEREDQAAYLVSAGCEFGQGYFFGRPMPTAEFKTLLAPSGMDASR
jgi:diguanylate cyclase (GGDEF)-like protein